MTHTTILRWVQSATFQNSKSAALGPTVDRGGWTRPYIKVHGQWVYQCRAVDKAGKTVDFYLSRNRDVNAAKWFLRSAIKNGSFQARHRNKRDRIEKQNRNY